MPPEARTHQRRHPHALRLTRYLPSDKLRAPLPMVGSDALAKNGEMIALEIKEAFAPDGSRLSKDSDQFSPEARVFVDLCPRPGISGWRRSLYSRLSTARRRPYFLGLKFLCPRNFGAHREQRLLQPRVQWRRRWCQGRVTARPLVSWAAQQCRRSRSRPAASSGPGRSPRRSPRPARQWSPGPCDKTSD